MTERQIKRVAVLGAGTMGHGIAQAAATAGMTVIIRDVNEEVLGAAKGKIEKSLAKLASKGKIEESVRDSALAAISTSTDLEEAVKDADLVVEAIPEVMTLKVETFTALDRLAPAHALLGTNTSSLSVTEIAGVVADPGRVVGMHFFNPVPIMKLLEVVRGLRTSDESVAAARSFGERLGKTPIVVRDWPGFASSRLGVALGAEAIRMLQEGVASPEDIDTAMELGYRHPMGPLRLTDLVGLDVRLSILDHLHRELGEQFRPPTLLRQMVRAGKLGRKSGEGFYKYD
ncbi:MAG: 3-hydroxyacyl-CoA dehydrogenase family protein [Deltaproteobacteria bacterium]|nr:3-hydroxyacyl-CoA dehydrogenase family protein [Deltaproteobacteria bacterium]